MCLSACAPNRELGQARTWLERLSAWLGGLGAVASLVLVLFGPNLMQLYLCIWCVRSDPIHQVVEELQPDKGAALSGQVSLIPLPRLPSSSLHVPNLHDMYSNAPDQCLAVNVCLCVCPLLFACALQQDLLAYALRQTPRRSTLMPPQCPFLSSYLASDHACKSKCR